MRQFVFKILHDKGMERQHRIVRVFMVALIFTSTIALVLTSEPEIDHRFGRLFTVMEAGASCIFLIEYCLRIWSATENNRDALGNTARFRYIFSFMGLVDLGSFLPFFFLLTGFQETPPIMLLQLLRLFKLTRYSPAFKLLADVLKDESESLLVSVMLMFIIFIFSSVGIYTFERHVQPEAFGSIPQAMWWAIVTLTTVGYGDVTPVTVEGKIFATLITVVGVGLVSLPAGIIASGFTEQLRFRREQFQSEVEQLMQKDGYLSSQDMNDLDMDRRELGLDRDKASLIISQVQQREQNLQRRSHRKDENEREN